MTASQALAAESAVLNPHVVAGSAAIVIALLSLLVYLYRRGSFYPFAPSGPQQRDNLLEIQVRDALAAELPMEKDLQRWLAVWGAPGL